MGRVDVPQTPGKTDLSRLFNASSIVIIGASPHENRSGGKALRYILDHGYSGEVLLVNPKYHEIHGLRCFPAIGLLPSRPSVAIVATPAERAITDVALCGEAGIEFAVVYAAGFGEAGPAGEDLQRKLTAAAAAAGIRLVGPNCLGFANFQNGLLACLVSASGLYPPPPPGGVAIVAQSGAMSSILLQRAKARGIGVSFLVSTGDEADLGVCDYLEYALGESSVTGALVYLEGVPDGRRLMRIGTAYATTGKGLFILKAGESAPGRAAAVAHTAALTGDYLVFQTAARQAGIGQASDMEHLESLGYLWHMGFSPGGGRVGVVSTSGGAAALLCDALQREGIDVAALSDVTFEKLRGIIPGFGLIGNPVDVTGNASRQPELLVDSIATLCSSGDVDLVIVFLGTYNPAWFIDELKQALRDATVPVLVIDTVGYPEREQFEAMRLPVFSDISACARALAAFAEWSSVRARMAGGRPSDATYMQNPTTLSELLSDSRDELFDEHRGKRIIREFGVPVVAEGVAHSAQEAVALAQDLGYPCVLKTVAPGLVHKTEFSAVRLDLRSAEEVRAAYGNLMRTGTESGLLPSGALVQSYVPHVLEFLIGVITDPIFGPLLVVGLGGIMTEALNSTVRRILPLAEGEAAAMVSELASRHEGFLRRLHVGVAELTKVAAAVDALAKGAWEYRDVISEVEVNPLVLNTSPPSVAAVDALVRLRPKYVSHPTFQELST